MHRDQPAPSSSTSAAVANSSAATYAAPVAKRRRWFQFSLRSLLVGMMVVSAVSGFIGIRAQRARRQHAAADFLLRLGGASVEYTHADGIPYLVRNFTEPWLGRDFFDSVVSVHVDLLPADTTAGQLAVWQSIGDLPQLAKLTVDYPRRYPRSRFNIGPISRLGSLEFLKIRDAQIAGDDLAPLAKMPSLERLDLSHCQIGDGAWRHLASVPKLHSLNASYSFVTDAGAAELATCQNLRQLVLTRAIVTDRGAAELAKMSGLETLVLDGTRITDAGLAHLARLENLLSLSICETNVTDKGIDNLAASARLRLVEAGRTNVSEAALQQFNDSRLRNRVHELSAQ